ncbi:MAG: 30S ribosomal protein S20 [Synergistaceae bacterium]|nr:30S ribosomal protein S20 [Synergistota bacterium]NLM70436.1 30S ribosomal protein S20 [Synergistaceae bacterium]
MPNTKSAIKRMRTNERNRLYNRFWKTRCKNAVKKVLKAVEGGDEALALTQLAVAQSVIDKAVVKGVMHRNTAARRKSMITKKVKGLSAVEQPE